LFCFDPSKIKYLQFPKNARLTNGRSNRNKSRPNGAIIPLLSIIANDISGLECKKRAETLCIITLLKYFRQALKMLLPKNQFLAKIFLTLGKSLISVCGKNIA